MPTKVDESLYSNAVKWMNENHQDKSISDEIKQDFLRFNTLPPENKVQLLITLNTLLETTGLPQEIEISLPWLMFDLDGLPEELLVEIGSHLKNESDKSNLVRTSKKIHSLFQPIRLLDKFLERVAYGEQDTAERLFTDVYQGNEEKIQIALCCKRRFTDYSGRTFNCTAYEYAYWAKDTYMCRMLEHYMDDPTKAQTLARIDKIENTGLSYQQHGDEHQSAHFDLIPLKTALQEYLNGNGQDAWFADIFRDEREAAWMKVGMAQRDVPAHIAQEYCRTDRPFDPIPSFNVDREDIPKDTLPRGLAFYNWYSDCGDLWFPLVSFTSGLGFDFAIMRGEAVWPARAYGAGLVAMSTASTDLAVITRLEEVRTIDLKLSCDHLNPPVNLVMSM